MAILLSLIIFLAGCHPSANINLPSSPASGGSSSVANQPLTPDGTLRITTTSLPDGRVGRPYEVKVGVTGGTAPYSWTISQGKLPDNVRITEGNGFIIGIPVAGGDYSFTVQVQDSDLELSSQNFIIHIVP